VVGRGDVDVCARYVCYSVVRATLHLEAKSIRCVRGLKSSLLIGQKAQIGHKLELVQLVSYLSSGIGLLAFSNIHVW
jgi:hypothetical protein